MSEMDVYSVKKKTDKRIDIRYVRAKMSKRVFARIIDIILLLIVGASLFLGVRAIVNNTEAGRGAIDRINETRVDSGIYIRNTEGEIEFLVDNLSRMTNLSGSVKVTRYEEGIEKFLAYAKEVVTADNYQRILDEFDDYRLLYTYDDVFLFVSDDNGGVIRNPEADFGTETYTIYADHFYVDYYDSYLLGYFMTMFPQYLEDTRFLNNMILFVELPIAVIISSLLVYLVPPLIFKRNRQTIGMLLYRIGKCKADLFWIDTKKFVLYDLLFIFVVICLSFLTLGVPIIISVTMMAFTKNKQDFAEYMFKIEEVDVSDEMIYKDYDEIYLSYRNKKTIDFRNITGE